VKAKAARTVQEARQQILENHVPTALKRLKAILNSDDASNADIINAAKALLHASGVTAHGTAVTVNVEQVDPRPAIDIMCTRLLEIQTRRNALAIPEPPTKCPHCGMLSTDAVVDDSGPDAEIIDVDFTEHRDPEPATT